MKIELEKTLNEETLEEINIVLEDFETLFRNSDWKNFANKFSNKKNYVHLGSTQKEVLWGQEDIYSNFLKFNEYINTHDYKILERHSEVLQINVKGNFCWAVKQNKMKVEVDGYMINRKNRTTFVMEKEGNIDWKIIHWHSSSPESGANEDTIIPTKKGFTDELENWIQTFELNPIIQDPNKMAKIKKYLEQAKKEIESSTEFLDQ